MKYILVLYVTQVVDYRGRNVLSMSHKHVVYVQCDKHCKRPHVHLIIMYINNCTI